jgi:hypothetical protein
VLLEDPSGRFGVLLVDFTIASRNGRNKSIYIGHELLVRVGISETQLISGAAEGVGWHVS